MRRFLIYSAFVINPLLIPWSLPPTDQLPEEDRAKCQPDYERLFNEQALWSSTSNENALVRRAAYGLLRALVTGWPSECVEGSARVIIR